MHKAQNSFGMSGFSQVVLFGARFGTQSLGYGRKLKSTKRAQPFPFEIVTVRLLYVTNTSFYVPLLKIISKDLAWNTDIGF